MSIPGNGNPPLNRPLTFAEITANALPSPNKRVEILNSPPIRNNTNTPSTESKSSAVFAEATTQADFQYYYTLPFDYDPQNSVVIKKPLPPPQHFPLQYDVQHLPPQYIPPPPQPQPVAESLPMQIAPLQSVAPSQSTQNTHIPEYMHERDFRIAHGDVAERLSREKALVKQSQDEEKDKGFQYRWTRNAPTDLESDDLIVSKFPEPLQVGPHFVGIYAAQGMRPTMEDAHLASEFSLTIGEKTYPVQLFGIFDGHRGSKAANLLEESFQKELQKQLLKYNQAGLSDEGIFNALKLTFVEFQIAHSREFMNSGSTATVAMILDEKIWTANVGDSRTVLDNGTLHYTPEALSRDAKPFEGIEKMVGQPLLDENGRPRMSYILGNCLDVLKPSTIKANGGFYGSIRKRGGDVLKAAIDGYPTDARIYSFAEDIGLIGLSMARSVGDIHVKGATCRPKITVRPFKGIGPNNNLVLCCDGIWDVCSTRELVHAVHTYSGLSLQELAEDIANSAYRCGSTDNLSVMVIRLAV